MIKKSYLENFYYFLLLFYIFFNLIFNVQSYAIWGLTIVLVVIETISHKKMKFGIDKIPFILLTLIMLVGSFVSPRTGEALKFTVSFACLVLMFIIQSNRTVNEKYIFKLILIFSGVHVFATLFYQLFPSVWMKILPLFLKGNDLSNNIYVFNVQHINCGLSPVQSANAMYITAFIVCVFSRALQSKKIGMWFLTIIGFIALMLTSKRGVMLSVVISSVITYLIYNKKVNKGDILPIIKMIILGIIIISIGYIIVKNYFPDALRIINRFTNQKDITTGRSDIYSTLYDNYKKGNVFIGNGLFSSRNILYSTYGEINDAHNIYLQVLVELGIPGILCFATIVFVSFSKIFKTKLNKNSLLKIMGIFYIFVFYIYGVSGNGLFDLTIAPMWLLMMSFVFNNIKEKEVG